MVEVFVENELREFVENELRDKSLEDKAELVKNNSGKRALVLRAGNEFPDCGRLQFLGNSDYGLIMNDGQHIFLYEELRAIYILVEAKSLM